jgi:hypothetical protein
MRQPSSNPHLKRPQKRRQRQTRDSSTPESPGHEESTRLKTIEYRSYMQDIQLYHFRLHLSLRDLRRTLTQDKYARDKTPRQEHGYVDMLIGTDTLAKKHFVPEGDETPANCLEVAYLPGVFTQSGRTTGSALGFRTNDTIEWACFDRSINDSVLKSWIWDQTTSRVQLGLKVHADDARKLFDLVAIMPKGLETKRATGGNVEHKQWHTSLSKAQLRPLKLRITWKNKIREAVAAQQQPQVEENEWEDEDGM